MPCINSSWDTFLDKDSPEYSAKRASMLKKLDSVRHVIDYYFGVQYTEIPEMIDVTYASLLESPWVDVKDILESICFHIACDGMSIPELYDIVSLETIPRYHGAAWAVTLTYRSEHPKFNTQCKPRTRVTK